MARGKTLLYILDGVRAEARLSLNPAHNAQVRDSHVKIIQRVQESLYDDFDWPHLRIERLVSVEAGQRYIEPPADMAIDRIESIDVRFNQRWRRLEPSINPEQYLIFDSYLGVRSTPIYRWRLFENETIELWPIPADTTSETSLEGKLRFTGIRKLNPLVDDGDRCDLDATLIILFAAAQVLAGSNAKDAELKYQQAQKRLDMTKRNLSPRRKVKMFGIGEEQVPILRGPPTVYYRTTS